ncbi:MAG TPA: NADP-dependent isocitrate dehydrogenase [Ornithinimicrobium sp.]|uniref:NADP-dependent isocitrate dehydrogenase n=1 Tax=Ornithinimicrobium sp. TaxID=1977084 RepID=UPI002B45E5FF|nr:NADP-dependent isocitrate dehydrogenase [Ornithinimicrobium sp.]HKJ12662.1 NADP-dependent isocitrate dehydrogenase [Ornithinimicrobium sp.]
MPTITYTVTDEAPMLATHSLKPIVEAFAATAGIDVETRDISLAARTLAAFADVLPEGQRVPDALAELGEMTSSPRANIVKLPNISASLPQLKAAVAELQSQGYDLPDYPESPSGQQEQDARARYDSVKGSAVNPVLRQGNSDRRAPASVKNFARSHPHSMGPWSADSKSNVATMEDGDFRHTEKSVVMEAADTLRIVHVGEGGAESVLKDGIEVQAGEIVDAAVMRVRALRPFLSQQVDRATEEGLLFSVHLKATMMKVSDPIIFGHTVSAVLPEVFDRYGDEMASAGLSPNHGLGGVLSGLDDLEEETAARVRAAIDEGLEQGPDLAMVDSDRGVSGLHVPSDIIIDASMPAMIRSSGQMYAPDGAMADALAVIPDSSYAGVYQAVLDDCRAHGAFDPATMGSVPNVGLMAQKAEEYGSHDKTFEVEQAGVVRVLSSADDVLLEHEVGEGDIWRACQTKDVPVREWVALAVARARATGAPAVFWLDEDREHDAHLVSKVREYLEHEDTEGLQLEVMAPVEATGYTLGRVRSGEDTISVTGNVLRDYLTDLFPILELGTSAKMLSVVPLISGGGLFETGAGGSAPKHMQQLLSDNHLRWDSLGEFLALAVSLEHLAQATDSPAAAVLAAALDRATERLLSEGRSPSRTIGEIDNRGSHVYLALYWAHELAEQSEDADLAQAFSGTARDLAGHEEQIVAELREAQGRTVEIGGYYHPDKEATTSVMRPSATFNRILGELHEPDGV